MRWVVVAIVAYVCMAVQTSLFRPGLLGFEIEGHTVQPDLVLVFGVFLALVLEPYEVFVVGWSLGLASDLASAQPRLGVAALLFAVVLYLLSQLQGSVFRARVLTQFLLSLVVVFLIHWGWTLMARYASGVPLPVARAAMGSAFDAVYSAILAPYLFWLFFRLRGPLRLPPGSMLD